MASTASPPATTEPGSSSVIAPGSESAPATTTTSTSTTAPVDVPPSQQQQQLNAPMKPDSAPTSTPVEMSTLAKDDVAADTSSTTPAATAASQPEATPSISADKPLPETIDTDPQAALTVTILTTDGPRHSFKLNSKYLVKKKIAAEAGEPLNMTVFALKELIWGEWKGDWPSRPTSPNSIRLISFGKVLDDESPLKDNKFNHDSPNIVHMAIRPQDVVDEEDAKGAHASRPRSAQDRSPGCRCVIM